MIVRGRKKHYCIKAAACAIALSLLLQPCAYAAQETDADSVLTAAREAQMAAMAIDLSPQYERLKQRDQSVYENVAASADIFSEMADAVNASATTAADSAAAICRSAASAAGSAVSVRYPERTFSWQEMAAMDRAYGKEAVTVIAEETTLSIVREADGRVELSLELPLVGQVFSSGSTAQYMTGLFALSYLNTVYGASGAAKAYEEYPFDAPYLRTVAHPLPDGVYWIKNGWYAARDGGERFHTGTDITAPARTRIHSVTDGVVTHIGYMKTPGNFVVVKDPYGFEYHYYHMVQLSKQVRVGDVVKQGDWIGLVGNTGNSSRPHLHLTIVSPEYTYINPYDMFLLAGIGPIRNS